MTLLYWFGIAVYILVALSNGRYCARLAAVTEGNYDPEKGIWRGDSGDAIWYLLTGCFGMGFSPFVSVYRLGGSLDRMLSSRGYGALMRWVLGTTSEAKAIKKQEKNSTYEQRIAALEAANRAQDYELERLGVK